MLSEGKTVVMEIDVIGWKLEISPMPIPGGKCRSLIPSCQLPYEVTTYKNGELKDYTIKSGTIDVQEFALRVYKKRKIKTTSEMLGRVLRRRA